MSEKQQTKWSGYIRTFAMFVQFYSNESFIFKHKTASAECKVLKEFES